MIYKDINGKEIKDGDLLKTARGKEYKVISLEKGFKVSPRITSPFHHFRFKIV